MQQIKVSFFDMIDPFAPAYMLGYEQGFAKDYSLLLEGGPVSSFDGRWVMQDPIEGYKLRGELRYFIKLDDDLNRFYIGLQGMYRKTTKSDLSGTFCRDNCNFFQELEYDFIKEVVAGHLSLGINAVISEHLILDVGGFFGLRHITKWDEGIPEDADRVSEDFINFNLDVPGDSTIPSLGLAFRMGFGW